MTCIGVTWDHPSGVALLKNGAIVAAVNEERYSRKKNDGRFPAKSLDYVSQVNGGANFDCVGVASTHPSYSLLLVQYHTLSVRDMLAEQHKYWYPRLYEGKDVDVAVALADKCVHDQYPAEYWAGYDKHKQQTFPEDSRAIIANYLGLHLDKVVRFDHHLCHNASAYYGSGFDKCYAVSVDAFGDCFSSKIYWCSDGKMQLRRTIPAYHSPAHHYAYVTALLGYKVTRHEGKITGLAALGNPQETAKILGKMITYSSSRKSAVVRGLYHKAEVDYLAEALKGHKKEDIAAGVQQVLERVVTQFLRTTFPTSPTAISC